MYIYSFLKDIAITNSFILSKFAPTTDQTISVFRKKLAVQLIGDYCSRKLPGCRRSLTHFPLEQLEGKRGRCQLCKASNKRSDTTWYCQTCQEWFCHSGKADSDCFLLWHKRVQLHIYVLIHTHNKIHSTSNTHYCFIFPSPSCIQSYSKDNKEW